MVESKEKPAYHGKYKVKDCVRSKGVAYCCECGDFPYRLIKNLEKNHNKRYRGSLIENGEIVRKRNISSHESVYS